jgi:hypothetical protein
LLFWAQDSTTLFAFPKPEADRARAVIDFVNPTKFHTFTLRATPATKVDIPTTMLLNCAAMLLERV